MNRKRISVGILLLCAVQAFGTTRASGCPMKFDECRDNSLPQRVPIKIYRDFLVVVEGQIGGGQIGRVLEHQNFVLDTGTSPSIINEKIVKKLGLPTVSATLVAVGRIVETNSAVLPQLEVGPISAASLRVQVKDLSQLERDCGIPIAAIVGMDVLAKASFHLDYEQRQIEFGDIADEGIPVTFDARSGIAVAHVKLGGRAVRMVVDTGSDQVLLLGGNFADSREFALHMTSNRGVSVADDKMTVQEFAARDIQLAGEHFSREKAYFLPGPANPGFDGLLGVRALGFHAISFDQARGTFYLQK